MHILYEKKIGTLNNKNPDNNKKQQLHGTILACLSFRSNKEIRSVNIL